MGKKLFVYKEDDPLIRESITFPMHIVKKTIISD